MQAQIRELQGTLDKNGKSSRNSPSVQYSRLSMSNHMDAIGRQRLPGQGSWTFAQLKAGSGWGVPPTTLTLMCTNAALRVPEGPLGSPDDVYETLIADADLETPELDFPLAFMHGMPNALEQALSIQLADGADPWDDAKDLMRQADPGQVREACKKLRDAVSRLFQPSALSKDEAFMEAVSVLCPAREAEVLVCTRHRKQPAHDAFLDISSRLDGTGQAAQDALRYLTWADRGRNVLSMEEVRRRQTARFAAVRDFATPDAPFDCATLVAVSLEQELRRGLAKDAGVSVRRQDVVTAAALGALYEAAVHVVDTMRNQAYSFVRSTPPFPHTCQWHKLSAAQLYTIGAVLGPLWTFLRGEEASASTWGFVTRAFRDTLEKDDDRRKKQAHARAEQALAQHPVVSTDGSAELGPCPGQGSDSGSGSGSESGLEPGAESSGVLGDGGAVLGCGRSRGTKRPRSDATPLRNMSME